MFKVVVARLVAWRLVTIQKIVVQRYGYGLDAVDGQLHAEAFAGGGLAARRRTGYQYHFYPLCMGYLVGYLGYLLLLQGFRDLYQLRREAFVNDLIQVAHVAQVHDVLPLVVLLEDAEHLVLTDEGSELRGVFTRRYAQQQTVEVVFQSEQVYLRRVGQQCPIVVVLVTVNVVVGGKEASCTLQQLHLRQRPGLLEHADGFFRRCLVTVDGYGSINDVLHLLSQSGGIVRGHRPT